MRAHGTRAKYVFDRCRCAPCRAANNRYARERTRAKSAYRIRSVGGGRAWQVERRASGNRRGRIVQAGIRERSDAERICSELNAELDVGDHGPWATGGRINAARRYLETLAARGIRLRGVARLTGLSRDTIRDLMTGKRRPTSTRPARRRPLASTCDRILGIRLDSELPGGALVPAGETWCLVDELIAAGVPRVRIARAIGQVGSGLQLARDRVTKRNADAVARFHREFFSNPIGRAGSDRWVHEGPRRVDPCEGVASTRVYGEMGGHEREVAHQSRARRRNPQPGDSSASRVKPRRRDAA